VGWSPRCSLTRKSPVPASVPTERAPRQGIRRVDGVGPVSGNRSLTLDRTLKPRLGHPVTERANEPGARPARWLGGSLDDRPGERRRLRGPRPAVRSLVGSSDDRRATQEAHGAVAPGPGGPSVPWRPTFKRTNGRLGGMDPPSDRTSGVQPDQRAVVAGRSVVGSNAPGEYGLGGRAGGPRPRGSPRPAAAAARQPRASSAASRPA
jgi:hypothetical protein